MDDPSYLYLFLGFGAVWAIVAAYVIHLGLREGGLRRQLENVRKMVESREKS